MRALSSILCLSLGAVSAVHAAAPPSVIGDLRLGARRANDVVVSGEVGILVTKRRNGAELLVLRLADPQSPEVVGTLEIDADVNAAALDGDYAYLATDRRDFELRVVDISAPSQARLVATVGLPSRREARSLKLAGSVLFVGTKGTSSTGSHELFAYDVSVPDSPRLLDSVDVGGTIEGLALDGDTLYAATSDNAKELVAFDVRDPAHISTLASVDLPGSANARAVAVDRLAVYVLRRSGARSLSVIDKQSLQQVAEMSLRKRVRRIQIYRDRAYIAAEGASGGLLIVDVSDTSNPELLQDLRGDGSATSVDLAPPFAYLSVAGSVHDALVVDIESQLRPNVIIVYTDDQHFSTTEHMPTVEALAERGMTFRQSFVTTPLCGPSRASLLTGLYAHNHGALINVDYIGDRIPASDQSTVATWLQAAGYRTGFFGKYVNEYDHECGSGTCRVPPGWEEWQAIVRGHYFNYTLSHNGVEEPFGATPAEYSTDVLTGRVLEFIAEADARPFLAVLATNAPHSDDGGIEVTPAPRHDGAFSGVTPWRPPSYDEEDVSDKTSSIFASLPRADTVIAGEITWGFLVDAIRQRQLEALLAVDEGLAAILARLEELELDRDTLVIFTSDNGFNLGEHRLWIGKSYPYENSIRVPFVAAYPRLIAPGTIDDVHMVLNIDLAPTIVEMANAAPFGSVDGESLVPLFKNDPGVTWRSDFLIENYGSFFLQPPAVYHAIRDQNFLYVYYAAPNSDEIYDLVADADELVSRTCDEDFDDVRSLFRERIDQLVTNPALQIPFLPIGPCGP